MSGWMLIVEDDAVSSSGDDWSSVPCDRSPLFLSTFKRLAASDEKYDVSAKLCFLPVVYPRWKGMQVACCGIRLSIGGQKQTM
jgi:hypothetical protein